MLYNLLTMEGNMSSLPSEAVTLMGMYGRNE
uniref:Uncharacterized protein n=1 Tax=Arundo donax TaxID=35708 RepID=A0A0A8XMT7_ARUDO